MAYAKKDLFTIKCTKEEDRKVYNEIPPREIIFRQIKLFYLGESNKKDLLNEVNIGSAAKDNIQYIYVDSTGEFFEVVFSGEENNYYIIAIRTRRKDG